MESKPLLSRRERKRLDTFEELVEVSRRLLNDGSDMSLRAVAAAMGMTAPGLYRYVDSTEAHHALVAGGILHEVTTAMTAVRADYPDDPAGQLAATTALFRSWALSRPMEFQLVFATPRTARPHGSGGPVSVDHTAINYPSGILSDFFGGIFADLCLAGRIQAPLTSELDPAILAVVHASVTDSQRPLLEALGDRGPGTIWVLKLAWARLYGVLTMEVFGQIESEIISSGLLFGEMMRETFVSLGFDDDWDRLLGIAQETTDRETPYRRGA